MFLVVPLMAWGINLAKMGKFRLHKQVQLTLASILLLLLVRSKLTCGSLPIGTTASLRPITNLVGCIAACGFTWLLRFRRLLLWIVVTVGALRNFPTPLRPNGHSHLHKKLGKLAAVGMMEPQLPAGFLLSRLYCQFLIPVKSP